VVLGATEGEATGLAANPICREMAKRSSLPPLLLSTSPISPVASGDEAPHDAWKYPPPVPGTPAPSANRPRDEPPVLPDDDEELACCSYWQAVPPPMAKGYCRAPEGRPPTVALAAGELLAAEEAAAAAAAAACIWRWRRRERERRFWNQ
jgi:hypothetical protein